MPFQVLSAVKGLPWSPSVQSASSTRQARHDNASQGPINHPRPPNQHQPAHPPSPVPSALQYGYPAASSTHLTTITRLPQSRLNTTSFSTAKTNRPLPSRSIDPPLASLCCPPPPPPHQRHDNHPRILFGAYRTRRDMKPVNGIRHREATVFATRLSAPNLRKGRLGVLSTIGVFVLHLTSSHSRRQSVVTLISVPPPSTGSLGDPSYRTEIHLPPAFGRRQIARLMHVRFLSQSSSFIRNLNPHSFAGPMSASSVAPGLTPTSGGGSSRIKIWPCHTAICSREHPLRSLGQHRVASARGGVVSWKPALLVAQRQRGGTVSRHMTS
ncbi:hypothetical protein CMUS01_13099 [Colletotrichum musicola]|uniref:Uncharacterized protein n=1 Tax=Colletotrichum musicola TaxID=2175873 RepID=A0A8H6MXW8_9PEZI|nr:hypothetical protein CMUS01_13099 [Colletotrichum musicola]